VLHAELVLAADAELAEGPHWDSATKTLLWVDMARGEVHRLDPGSGHDRVEWTSGFVAAAVPRVPGGIVVAEADSLVLVDRDGRVEHRRSLEHRVAGLALNDGKCDPTGRFWVGSGGDEVPEGVGRLYSLERDRSLTVRLDHVTLSNGVGWSPDGERMYYIDSASGRIDIFDYVAGTGEVTNRRKLAGIPAELGMPDGLSVDSEEGVWVAIWGGGQVRRYTREGELDLVVSVPRTNTTSCAFGGDDLRFLFITTASDEGASPSNGAIYGLRVPYAGQPGRDCAA
jgi:sugar lactone lactonase YvrE